MASSLRRNAGRNERIEMNMGGSGEFLSMSRCAPPPRKPPLRACLQRCADSNQTGRLWLTGSSL